MQNLQSFQSSAKTPDQLIQDANQQNGVTSAQQQVQGLQGAIANTTNLLNQVAPSVMGRTQNSLVTSAQANQQIANGQAPIQANLSKDTDAYNTANTAYANDEQNAQNQANAELTGQTNQESYLQGIYNDLYTQEQNAAQSAEAQREFNAQLNASGSSAGSGVAGDLASLFGGSTSSPTAATPTALPTLPTGTVPSQAVASLFKGYNPSADKNYTENVVIPTLEKLMTENASAAHQNISSALIAKSAQSLAYGYRKTNFGE